MSVRTRGGWELPENRATPESIYLNRRALIAGVVAVAGASAIGGMIINRRDPATEAARAAATDPSRGLYPAARNERYAVARAVTPEVRATTWNNFYEFGAGKDIVAPAQDEEFVISHADNVQSTGFVEHLKLPHYVDFQSELQNVRRMRAEAAE